MNKTVLNPATLFGMIIFLFFNFVNAQSVSSGAYASVEFQVSSVNRGLGLIVGLSGGYQTKNGLIIGAEIYDLLNGTLFPDNNGSPSNIDRKSKMHFGGLVFGYEFNSFEETRLRFSTLIGFGDISAYTVEKNYSEDASIYFVAQPKVSIIFFKKNNLHLVLDTGYRFHYGVDTPGTNNSLLGGAFFGVTGEYSWHNDN